MHRFLYEALDKNGKKVRDEISAPDKKAAKESIRDHGLKPTAIKQIDGPPPPEPSYTFAVQYRGVNLWLLEINCDGEECPDIFFMETADLERLREAITRQLG